MSTTQIDEKLRDWKSLVKYRRFTNEKWLDRGRRIEAGRARKMKYRRGRCELGEEVKVDRRENGDDSSVPTDDGSKVRHGDKGRRAEERKNFEN